MESDSDFTNVLIALALVVITILFFIVKKFLKKGKEFVLLTGLNESGKTLIFTQLLHNKHVPTFTSIQENVEKYGTEKEVKLVDLPGFHSIRQQFFEKYKDSSKGIIYVVDSVTVTKNIRDVAIVLYNILIDPAVVKNKPNLLILCNKQDQTTAKGSQVIKSMLEKEINTVRNTQLNAVKQLDSKENFGDKLGDPNKDFSFSNLYTKVEFIESHAFSKNGSTDLDGLKVWISKVTS